VVSVVSVVSRNGRVLAIGTPPTFRQQVARAMETESEAVGWMPTVAAAEDFLGDADETPNVLVLSPAIKEPDAFGLAEFVGRSSPITAVLLVRERAVDMNGLLTAAMRAGIRDVIDLSRGGEDLREALKRAISWSQSLQSARGTKAPENEEEHGKVISVFSSKGGTGKTFLACNLAAALAQHGGSDAALVDLDVEMGDALSYFGKEPTKPLQDFLSIGDQVDREAVLAAGTKLTQSLWGYASPADPAPGSVSGEAMGKVIRTLRGTFAYTVIDATTQYSDPVLTAFDLSDWICLISGLDVVGLRHLSLGIQTLHSLGFPRERFHIVLNRADSKVGLQPSEVEHVLKLRMDSTIPSSRLVPMSLNRGLPVVLEQPKSDVAKAIGAIAEKFMAPVETPVRKTRLFSKK
jgi:pilus assembly protein CpaE